ncbi:PRC-barrel domain-containing protein [Alteriqipengyuania lutimaris]|uniref:PRC-barrel domain-containing protein n=1 Tax=Alteriqipengyuania lutimaris TaxID=1538146 RepID=A0A395LGF0_9SPHN|nr:PRC-barrel domain-containing protein [Alteriqipengyuania lutimaris]MBB3035246.1 sporulation protein YlmC with PRC-barrel domain [Alteriqipengyuania lutimaris]RDS75843.1 hypothetical protein DL238_14250 [Alteriqipengyuania lutimaris]
MSSKYENLRELDDYQLVHEDQDLRGHSLMTHDGLHLGTIKRMLVDPDHDHVAGLVLEDNRIVPVSEIEVKDGNALIDPVDADGFELAPTPKRNLSRGRVAVRRRG